MICGCGEVGAKFFLSFFFSFALIQSVEVGTGVSSLVN